MKLKIFIVALLFTCFFVNNGEAKKFSSKKMVGQYALEAAGMITGTVVLARDRYTTKLNTETNDHPVLGKWKLKKGKQNLIIEWWSDAEFSGIVNETTEKDPQVITGIYTQLKSPFLSGPATFTRIQETNEVIHHIMIGRAKRRKVKGVDFFSYGAKKVNKKLRKEYKVAVYSRMATNEDARIEHKPGQTKPLHKFGVYNRKLHKYEIVEVYIVHKDYAFPDTSSNFPALGIDGTNVFAYDWREKGYKWKKKEQ